MNLYANWDSFIFREVVGSSPSAPILYLIFCLPFILPRVVGSLSATLQGRPGGCRQASLSVLVYN